VQSVLLLGGMIGLLSLCGWLVAGVEGLLWIAVGGGLSLLLSPRLSPRLLLRMYRAVRLGPADLPAVFEVLVEISRRAGLERLPDLYYVPSSTLNAFTVGSREVAIAVTDGLLRRLSLRELAAVLAHEVSHIRHNDLWLMGLADTVSRLTRTMSALGVFLFFLNLPLLLFEEQGFPWLLVGLLIFAPTLGSLLQLALSRTREFDADMDAAGLTGDPVGLAAALEKLERYQGRFWEELLLPGRRIPEPSLLRTHPPTEERIRRLMSLRPPRPAVAFRRAVPIVVPDAMPGARAGPRWRITGLWY
jgi:heat shock protein HtpX